MFLAKVVVNEEVSSLYLSLLFVEKEERCEM